MARIASLSLPLAVLAFAVAGTAAAAPGWTLVQADSRLGFSATQAGAEFEGVFERFDAEIRFDEQDLASSRFRVTVHTASASTGETKRDGILKGTDFFAVERYPVAVFEAVDFAVSGEGYVARGSLTLRGVTRPVPVRFTFGRLADGGARLEGSATVRRLDFGVGQGEWSATEWVGDEVGVKFDLRLAR